MPYWATLPVVGRGLRRAGFLIGLPALRLGGLYLALTTFALAVAMPQVLKYKAFEDWTGGVQGIVIDKPDAPFGLPLTGDQWLYLFTLVVAALMFCSPGTWCAGASGAPWWRSATSPLAAEAMGINLALFKTRTFAVSAMFTGVAGSLGAIVVQFVAPDSFGCSSRSICSSAWSSAASPRSPARSSARSSSSSCPTWPSEMSKAAPGAIYGVILIAVMFLMPSGAAGFLSGLLRRLFRRPERIVSDA